MNNRSFEAVRSGARAVLAACRHVTSSGLALYTTDTRGYYPGVYWRDFYSCVAGFGDLVPLDEFGHCLEWFLEPPLTVPAASDWDDWKPPRGPVLYRSRHENGSVEYNWEYPLRTPFSADNPLFAVLLVAEYVRRSGDVSIFRRHANKLEAAVRTLTVSPDGLIEHAAGPYVYGFYDTVRLTGEECFASVLYFNAARDFTGLYGRTGDREPAARWAGAASAAKAGLKKLWQAKEGMFLSDTGTNRQTDVWGSAYAVYSGAVDESMTARISEWFVRNYRRCVRRGHVRHLPAPEYWHHTGHDALPPGNYQNGGYWSTPSPWVMRTIAQTDASLAGLMAKSLAEAVIELNFPECINEDGTCKLPGYTASAAMALLALRNGVSRVI